MSSKKSLTLIQRLALFNTIEHGGEAMVASKTLGAESSDIRLSEIHPGEILLEEFIKPKQMTVEQLSLASGIPLNCINEIIAGTRAITGDIAVGLELAFKVESKFWINLQHEYDMRIAARNLA